MTPLEAIAGSVAGDAVLTGEDAAVLLGAHDIIAIGAMADGVRQRMHGNRTTFLRVLEMHVDAVPAALPPGTQAGEARLIGRPPTLDAACAAVADARRLAGGTLLSGFSLVDLAPLHTTSPDAYEQLRHAGLDAVAEVPIDVLPDAMSAVEAAREAGLLVHRATVQGPLADPIAVMMAALELHRATGAFRAFAPLPRTQSVEAPTTGYDDVKLVAVARLLLRGIPSIQVDWRLYGPKLAQVALVMGADDVDGVAAVETSALGARRSALAEIQGNIRAAGLEPMERDGRFERAPSPDGGSGAA